MATRLHDVDEQDNSSGSATCSNDESRTEQGIGGCMIYNIMYTQCICKASYINLLLESVISIAFSL